MDKTSGQALEREADRLGVSVAHYVRDAALSRLAYSEGLAAANTPTAFAWAQPQAPRDRTVLAQLDSAAEAQAQEPIMRARGRRGRRQRR